MKNNSFHNLKSVKKLFNLLYIENTDFSNDYKVYINKKNRLVEEPLNQLKTVHKRIFSLLKKIELPSYLYSSKTGVTYYHNAIVHLESDFITTIDLSKFFPKSNAIYIHKFFYNELKTSLQVANILMKICCIDIETLTINNKVKEWFEEVNTKLKYDIPKKHIPTGSSLSQLLAFLVFKEMFDEIFELCNSHNIKMTVFVDDITISSSNKIPKSFEYRIFEIVKKYGLEINKTKIKRYSINKKAAKITGVIINNKHKTQAKNSLHKDVVLLLEEMKKNPNQATRNKLYGKLNAINQVENNRFEYKKLKLKNII